MHCGAPLHPPTTDGPDGAATGDGWQHADPPLQGERGPVRGHGPQWYALSVAGVVAVLAAVVYLSWSAFRPDSSGPVTASGQADVAAPEQDLPPQQPDPVTGSPEATQTTEPPAPPQVTDPASDLAAPAPQQAVGDVRDQPAGLFCRDLLGLGYSYSAAVDYWRLHGQPDRMDADGNGVPCETVYPRASVTAYYQQVPAQPTAGPGTGLLCRDLADRGLDYASAVAYWLLEGAPTRMDIDGNGIPCETVYSDAEVGDYWGS